MARKPWANWSWWQWCTQKRLQYSRRHKTTQGSKWTLTLGTGQSQSCSTCTHVNRVRLQKQVKLWREWWAELTLKWGKQSWWRMQCHGCWWLHGRFQAGCDGTWVRTDCLRRFMRSCSRWTRLLLREQGSLPRTWSLGRRLRWSWPRLKWISQRWLQTEGPSCYWLTWNWMQRHSRRTNPARLHTTWEFGPLWTQLTVCFRSWCTSRWQFLSDISRLSMTGRSWIFSHTRFQIVRCGRTFLLIFVVMDFARLLKVGIKMGLSFRLISASVWDLTAVGRQRRPPLTWLRLCTWRSCSWWAWWWSSRSMTGQYRPKRSCEAKLRDQLPTAG